MKLKKVFDLCSKANVCRLVDQNPDNENTAQWMGDGSSLYLMSDLPYLEKQNIYTMFDVSPKKQDGFCFTHQTDGPPCCLADCVSEEKPVEKVYMQIVHKGKLLTPMKTSHGLILIDSKYLRPFEDQLTTTEYYERGRNLIAVKTGMYLAAVIGGVEVKEDLLEELHSLTEECGYTLQSKQIQFDRKTGEIHEEP